MYSPAGTSRSEGSLKTKRMQMKLSRFFSSFSPVLLLFALSGYKFVNGGASGGHGAKIKLFVFGDSYADTGNWKKPVGSAWKIPYGTSFPGKPAGRFSDGRVLTDFVAAHFGIKSPIPYERRRSSGTRKKLRFGMNFAYGGTGVFKTNVDQPNMTTQIDFFQQLIQQERVFTKTDLQHSVALVSHGGNDYGTYFNSGSPEDGVPDYTKSVVNQLVSNLKRIRDLGVPTIAFTGLEPLGCLPTVTTISSYKSCNDTMNAVAILHNQLLSQNIENLNRQRKEPVFVVLDLYNAFLSILQKHDSRLSAKLDYEDPLRPCCEGMCGSNDGSKYKVCKNPGSAFFWDTVHPAQQGWYGVYLSIRSSLNQLR